MYLQIGQTYNLINIKMHWGVILRNFSIKGGKGGIFCNEKVHCSVEKIAVISPHSIYNHYCYYLIIYANEVAGKC